MIECYSREPILENVILPVEQGYAGTPAVAVVRDDMPVNTYTTIVAARQGVGY